MQKQAMICLQLLIVSWRKIVSKTLFIPDIVRVNKYTRAGKMGKQIVCPSCKHSVTVYHFSWSGLGCTNCNQMIDKYDWELYPT